MKDFIRPFSVSPHVLRRLRRVSDCPPPSLVSRLPGFLLLVSFLPACRSRGSYKSCVTVLQAACNAVTGRV